MKVKCYNDETYTWQITISPTFEYADWYADIPEDVVTQYLKIEEAYREARRMMQKYVYRIHEDTP